MSSQEIKAYIDKAKARREELSALKAKGGKGWTEDLQEELDDAAMFIVDAEEVYNEKVKAESVSEPAYKVSPKEAGLIHAKIVHGRRFNPRTGKEESAPRIQKFTPSEWACFINNAKNLGYDIVEVLHKPEISGYAHS